MNNNYYILILLFILFSCENKIKEVKIQDSPNIANIEIKEYPTKMDFLRPDNYFDSIKYIILEETKESIFTSVNEIFYVDDKIIVYSERSKAIFFFDNNGKYINKIHKHGRGHGEYLSIGSVMVDESLKQVIVWDNEARKMLYYDFNGAFLKDIKDFCNGTLISDIINLSNGGFLCYYYHYSNDNKKFPTGLWEVDNKGKFVKYYYEIKEKYPSKSTVGLNFLFKHNDDNIGFLDFITNSTFNIDGDNIFCRSRYKMPDKTLADFPSIGDVVNLPMVTIMNYQETDNYIFIFWSQIDKNAYFTSVLNKSDNSIAVGNFIPMMKDYIMVIPNFVRNNRSDILTSIVEFNHLKPFLSYPDFAEKLSSLKNLPENRTNPIIQINYLK